MHFTALLQWFETTNWATTLKNGVGRSDVHVVRLVPEMVGEFGYAYLRKLKRL